MRESKTGRRRGGYNRRKAAGELVRRPRKTAGDQAPGELTYVRVPTPWPLKVLEFKCRKIKALKVLENEGGP